MQICTWHYSIFGRCRLDDRNSIDSAPPKTGEKWVIFQFLLILAAGEDFYELLTKTNVLPIRACLNDNLCKFCFMKKCVNLWHHKLRHLKNVSEHTYKFNSFQNLDIKIYHMESLKKFSVSRLFKTKSSRHFSFADSHLECLSRSHCLTLILKPN
jgi:hypothetical protein